jgi:hypothetical protein
VILDLEEECLPELDQRQHTKEESTMSDSLQDLTERLMAFDKRQRARDEINAVTKLQKIERENAAPAARVATENLRLGITSGKAARTTEKQQAAAFDRGEAVRF